MHRTSPFRHASGVALLCSAAALTGCGGERLKPSGTLVGAGRLR